MFTENLARAATLALKELYGIEIHPESLTINKTRKEFEGDYTLVVFPIAKAARKSPDLIGEELGNWLKANLQEIEKFNVVKGFLNLSLKDDFWTDFLKSNFSNPSYGFTSAPLSEAPVLIEFSSPNTNKPLHLGHIRNNLLGYSISEIFRATGKNILRVNLVNDRGIHICKSMLAWQKWGQNETPASSGMKGDHLVGKYYVLFDKHYKEEVERLKASGMDEETAQRSAPLMLEAQEMLRRWEKGDPEVIELWKMMNGWVYEGFDETYRRLGIQFDKIYYESDTYLLGKKLVEEGLEKGVFSRKEDGSVWVDLTDVGLDQKLLLRSDGTSVYITQDLGTAQLRYNEYHPQKMIYVVGNEQNYHFEVLTHVLRKLGKPYADTIFHLSYGMVELPEGKMKSREGTVVDADDLMDEMYETARQITLELGKAANLDEVEADKLFHKVGMAALKYFILKVDPKKNMLFNPAESIDFDGNTGPFIQYTFARIASVLRKAGEWSAQFGSLELKPEEKEVLRLLYDFPSVIQEAADEMNPGTVANFCYELARTYNQFYHNLSILHESDENRMNFRLALSKLTSIAIHNGMYLLGIDVPDQM
ncbi:MAG: arginine--tRNA ligase [Bacteroidales bacterium]